MNKALAEAIRIAEKKSGLLRSVLASMKAPAAPPPVADAEVEDLLHNLGQIAEFYEESWSGEVATDAAARIRSLHARAVRAEAERDEAQRSLAEAKEALKPFAACVGKSFRDDKPDHFRIFGEAYVRDFRRARATLAAWMPLSPETRHD